MIFEKQEHQEACVANILAALKGVDLLAGDFSTLRENLQQLAEDREYGRFPVIDKPQLDIVMETGTGKTFTYLKTIYELHKQFGQNKFVIILPRIAIKLGVIQNIALTKEHFHNEYRKHLNYIDYPSQGLDEIRNDFIKSSDLSILITTNSAFNSSDKKIVQTTETMFEHGNTWNAVAKKRPTVIIDEPHLLKGDKTTEYLAHFKDSLFIRFGATFPAEVAHKLANVAYSMDSISAFNERLVKKIAVTTSVTPSEESTITISNIQSKSRFDARYTINEQPHKTTINLKDDLGAKTSIAKYNGAVVTKITKKSISLSNGATLDAEPSSYKLTEDETRTMIGKAIDQHFMREEDLFNQGIKALALFFIPSVSDYRNVEGKPPPRIKEMFEEEYRTRRKVIYDATANEKYKKYLERDIDKDSGNLLVNEGYFSDDRDSNSDKAVADGVNLILNDKQRLLSLDEPLRFIFSVWALQEGWDNPNIFTIGKLADTTRDISRRQQVGRGLRIAVNQNGQRLTYKNLDEKDKLFEDINTLDMVVSGKEQQFIRGIQKEIQDASHTLAGDLISAATLKNLGLSEREANELIHMLMHNGIITYLEDDEMYYIQSPIRGFLESNREKVDFLDDARFKKVKQIFGDIHRSPVTSRSAPPKTVKVKKARWEQFKDLWETISRKSKVRYTGISEDKIISCATKRFNEAKVDPARQKFIRHVYNSRTNQIERSDDDSASDNAGYFSRHPISEFITQLAMDENYPLEFVRKLFAKIDIAKFKRNPSTSLDLLKHAIKESIHTTILSNIQYEFPETIISGNPLQNEQGELVGEFEHTVLGRFYEDRKPPPAEFLYDRIAYDSDIEKKTILNNSPSYNGNKVTVFAKIPKIRIPTPYKTYSPDFAYLITTPNEKDLFLVVESKGYKYESMIPQEDQKKIDYAKEFFDALQRKYPRIAIQFKVKVESDVFSAIVKEAAEKAEENND